MGYKHQRKVYKLSFEDYEGLEVSVRSVNVDEFLELVHMPTKDEKHAISKDKDLEQLFKFFADNLVSWNLEDENDVPVPTTYDGVKKQDLDFIMDIINGWQDAIGSVKSPLKESSNNGETSLVESLPMETLSPNQSN